jgi:hypothetical protein
VSVSDDHGEDLAIRGEVEQPLAHDVPNVDPEIALKFFAAEAEVNRLDPDSPPEAWASRLL